MNGDQVKTKAKEEREGYSGYLTSIQRALMHLVKDEMSHLAEVPAQSTIPGVSRVIRDQFQVRF